ncbi:hypothetical protein QQ045_022769 [Rhodiola kirilowii]
MLIQVCSFLSRYNNRRKPLWMQLWLAIIGLCIISLGCSAVFFLASYHNYPSGYALDKLHKTGFIANNTDELYVHIDTYSAMNGISRFCEKDFPWRYSKEEGIQLTDYVKRNFTYLIIEHPQINGFKCLFSVDGFSRARPQIGFPPILLVKEPKVFIHGNTNRYDVMQINWRGC